MRARKLLALCCVIIFSILYIGSVYAAVQSTQKNGYIEQILTTNGMERLHYLVTDWSKLQPLSNTSEGERDIFLCLIAAQMLETGMTWDEYFAYLDQKGITFELQELQGPWTVGGDEVLCLLNFSTEVSLWLIDDPVQHAVILVDSPFRYGCAASIPVDLEHTMTPYSILTDDGQLIDEP